MPPQMVMLNSEIPGIHSQRTPYYSEKLAQAYHHFFHVAHQHGERLVFASADDFDWQGNVIGHWVPYGNHWEPVAEPARIGGLFDKLGVSEPLFVRCIDRLIELGVPIFGHVGLSRFVSDKWGCYEAYRECSPLTARIVPDEESLIDQIYAFFEAMDGEYAEHSNRAVLKPVHGWESRGLHIVSRGPEGLSLRHLWGQPLEQEDHVRGALTAMVAQPYIIQAHVDIEEGIPEMGYFYQRHDSRFIFCITGPGQADFVHAYIKSPEGMLYVEPEQFPEGAFEVVMPIAQDLTRRFPYGIFCVDVMRDHSGRWFLTELNDQVGFNIDFSRPEDLEGVTRLMERYLHELRLMRDHPEDPRYQRPV